MSSQLYEASGRLQELLFAALGNAESKQTPTTIRDIRECLSSALSCVEIIDMELSPKTCPANQIIVCLHEPRTKEVREKIRA